MAGCRRLGFSVYIIGYGWRLSSRPLLTAAFVLAVALFTTLLAPQPADAHHLMCDWKVEKRTQTVWIDPNLAGSGVTRADVLAAFEPWNRLFDKYHGLPIFVEYRGDPSHADIVVTARGSERTWVRTTCTKGFAQQGATHSTVFLGPRDSWRNRDFLPHELGHALGFADHGSEAQHMEGHVGFQPCNHTYIGVMSYCSSPQTWFLDYEANGITFDGGLVRGYW